MSMTNSDFDFIHRTFSLVNELCNFFFNFCILSLLISNRQTAWATLSMLQTYSLCFSGLEWKLKATSKSTKTP